MKKIILVLWACSILISHAAANVKRQAADILNLHVFPQPIVWVGAEDPSAAQCQQLWDAIGDGTGPTLEQVIAGIEGFISQNPDSAWTPSLRSHLGVYYRDQSRYTRALDHWSRAWEATKQYESGPGKQVADYTLGWYGRLLAGLGRLETLKEIAAETEGRILDGGVASAMWNKTREAMVVMVQNPGFSYRCGTYALQNVGRALGKDNFTTEKLYHYNSPTNGFSVADLLQYSEEVGMHMVAVRRNDQQIVVPSVVLWKQHHYAAIVEERNGEYRVVDPTTHDSVTMSAETINEEASGVFLVAAGQAPNHWRRLDDTEARASVGRGLADVEDDNLDPGCGGNPGSAGGNGGDGSGGAGGAGSGGAGGGGHGGGGGGGGGGRHGGGGLIAGSSMPVKNTDSGGSIPGVGDHNEHRIEGSIGGGGGEARSNESNGSGSGSGDGPGVPDSPSGCDSGDCGGMAVWRVSEPFISLWVDDSPLGYQPALGPNVSLHLAYKQRDDEGFPSDVFNFGQHWKSEWLSYVNEDDTAYKTAMIHWPGGRYERRPYTSLTQPDGVTGAQLARIPTNGTVTSFEITYPNGAKDVYGFIKTNVTTGDFQAAFLTEKRDPTGNKLTFKYQGYGTTNPVVRLSSILDGDGHTNIIAYGAGSLSNQVVTVTDPFNRSVSLQYSSTNLTNITDVVGIQSRFAYDSNGWITNLTTPYGITSFAITGPNTTNLTGDEVVNRAIDVTLPNGGHHLFLYRDGSATTGPVIPLAYSGPMVPAGGTPEGTMDNYYMMYRNSWHWGPRQYTTLSTANFNSFTTNDYFKGRLRHFLHTADNFVGMSISMEREPSPDGISSGKMTWYDYVGKFYTYLEGTFRVPSSATVVQPDGNPTSEAFGMNSTNGLITSIAQTYLKGDGTVGTRTRTFTYNGADMTEEYDWEGRLISSNLFNAYHQVATNWNALNEQTLYFYNATSHSLTGAKYPSGLTMTNIYFTSDFYSGWLDKTIDIEIGRTNSYTYTNSLIYTHTDERGLTTTNFYDALNRLTGTAYPQGAISNIFYLRAGTNAVGGTNMLLATGTRDRLGNWTYFGYDGDQRVTSITNRLTNVTRFAYCACGSLDYVTNALQQAMHYSYDYQGRLTQTDYPGGISVTNSYDYIGRLLTVSDALGKVTNSYNYHDQIKGRSNAFGQLLALKFDIHGHVTNAVNANGVTVTNSFDVLGRILKRTTIGSGTETFAYTTRGLSNYVDGLSKTFSYGYDAADRKTSETNANSEVIQFSYNAAGDLRTLTDGKSQLTSWGYDSYGRVTSKTNVASTEILRYQYDAQNQVTNRWSVAKGNTVYSYDAEGNLTFVNYPVSADVTLSYDALNRLTNMVDGVGNSSYAYLSFGALASEDGPWASDLVSYTYNNAGLRSAFSVANPASAGWSQTYGYDSAERLTSAVSPAGTFTYSYKGAGSWVTNLALPNLSKITNGYDSAGRLTDARLLSSGGASLNYHGYTYNNGNQRTRQTRTDGSYLDYGYDNIGQLNSALGKESGGVTNRFQEMFSYTYDKAGNLSNRVNNVFTNFFGVDNLNQLSTQTRSTTNYTVAGTTTMAATGVTVNSSNATLYTDATFARTNMPLSSGNNTFTAIAQDSLGRKDTNAVTVNLPSSVTFVYDGNGNLTSDGNRTFAYDDENQLTSVLVTTTWKSEFIYDGRMRRRATKEYLWVNSAWVLSGEIDYVYDGNLVIEERDGSNRTITTYTRGKDLSGSLQGAGGIGGLLATTKNPFAAPAHYYYHADGNGNVTALVDSNQLIAARYIYDPFGNTISKSGPMADVNTYRFSSKDYHANSGLVYYGYRFYEPNLQRWLNRDPMGEAGFELLRSRRSLKALNFTTRIQPNLYTFVQNRPITLYDSLGLVPSGPGSVACQQAQEQALAAWDLYESEPSEENLALWIATTARAVTLCAPPPPQPPPTPWYRCIPPLWRYPFLIIPGLTVPGLGPPKEA